MSIICLRRVLLLFFAIVLAYDCVHAQDITLRQIITELSQFKDRQTGSAGYEEAADFIKDYLLELGLDPQIHRYPTPVRQAHESVMHLDGKSVALQPFFYNAITPQGIDGFIEAPLHYAASGSMADIEGKPIKNSIVLLEFDSGINWQQMASLGAKAVIFIHREDLTGKQYFREKEELSPIQFPMFLMEEHEALTLFGQLGNNKTAIADKVRIESSIQWKEVIAKNVYCLIPGSDPTLKKELLILEAFYDTSTFLPGRAPGAEEAASIATLLKTASSLKKNPPGRSVLLLATSGHDQTLAGLRELVWSMQSRSKELKKYQKQLKKSIGEAEDNLNLLTSLSFPLSEDEERDSKLAIAIQNRLKSSVDLLSRELVHLRLNKKDDKEKINKLVAKRFTLRQLGWKENFNNLTDEESRILQELLAPAIKEHKSVIKNRKKHLRAFKSTKDFREITSEFNIAAFISLHLSSHGKGVGGFHEGWLYQLKPTINRTGIYSTISNILSQSAENSGSQVPFVDSLRPSRMRTWDSWFLDTPFLGGEVSSLAGYLGLTLATVGDSRQFWGTPWDTPSRIDWDWLTEQEKLITSQTRSLSWAEELQTGKLPRNGFSTVTGRANLLLQGELFANYPAYKATLLAYQGIGKFYATVDTSGFFQVRGVADKKNVQSKVIIEGYRFDEKSGRVQWAIDKKETGKANYRVKMNRRDMKTNLTMFSCKETTIFDLLEPRNFNYLTKLQLYDGRRDAPPAHYWYSRIDTRSSIISSIYTEPGTWLKLTLSDTVLTRKLLLSNSTKESSFGFGYPVDNYSAIPNTAYYAAKDAWSLLMPRITNLESHGIVDPQVKNLQRRGIAALSRSTAALDAMSYGEFKETAFEALALAGRVYVQVEKTQKDVLFGVLFYIALFVPFAFCMERFLFNYANIYKRITAFLLLLVGLITIIYNVHPAFQLAYSPMVVILAFFIIGLSLMVTLILFFRFEEEMILLQRHASHKRPSEISHWKAFVAAFFLYVSNLRRIRLRTILTCLTLIILTFTIMSFTTVKSSQKHNKLLFQQNTPYHGLLLKTMNWKSLPRQASEILKSGLQAGSITAPRVWLDGKNVTRPVQVPLQHNENSADLQGLIGLSPKEIEITTLNSILTSGRWFSDEDRHSILIEDNTAKQLGINDNEVIISLWGMDFRVIGTFDGSLFDSITDLDGEPLTPVTFPQEASSELSEVEQEAMESGEDVRSMQSRYRHIAANQIAIIPSKTLLAMGGHLKNVAIKPAPGSDIDNLGSQLVDRFSLPIFAGEKNGVWFFSPSNTMSYSGVPNILIPLIISIFIVLNTMISSVYERKNEIAVYTSVGLAPSHVSFLFIAEALALAVISVVLGYLLAQVSAALFSSTSYWEGITVNYSSMAGVAAMILVIAVVLISVIYPSKVAARIAIPDVNRSFKLPAAVNNHIDVILPFFMKHEEQESIGGFIYSYLTGHQDISHGIFSTGPVDIIYSCSTVEQIQQMIANSDDPSTLQCMHIRSKVWLAPFDFGIMQEVDIQFCPARENSNYLEIKITLKRHSGELSMWERINTLFLHDIRKQLLIWRSIDDDTHKVFQQSLRNAIENRDHLTAAQLG